MAKRKGTQPNAEAEVKIDSTFEAVYQGRRLTSEHKLGHFWKKDFQDRAGGYTKQVAPAKIGERWKFSTIASGAVIVSGPHRPVLIGRQIANSETETWEALDAAHAQEFEAEKAARSLARRASLFEQRIEPLKQMMAALPSHNERAYFVQKVVTELWRRT